MAAWDAGSLRSIRPPKASGNISADSAAISARVGAQPMPSINRSALGSMAICPNEPSAMAMPKPWTASRREAPG